jgi:hypothetical protein
MSEGKRPGGLTALAVLNFVFGGLNAIGFLGLATLIALRGALEEAAEQNADKDMQQALEFWDKVGMWLFYVNLIAYAISAFLLIASGVGYLKQKRGLGRSLGNAYAIVAIAFLVITGVATSDHPEGGFSLGTLILLIYPALTLALLNTTFKEDFTR